MWEQAVALGTVVLAMALGSVIGWDRELSDKPAGLRTHMLVAGAAALLVAIGELLVTSRAVDIDSDLVRADPVRIVEAVITGVSFLGAGTIIRQSDQRVEGLTTAASLLFVAGVGICVALYQFVLAVGATLLALLVLRAAKLVERPLNH
jgi:putative Mg2+ transporter-C (MgtC) family protein